jgi:hypothetical protein
MNELNALEQLEQFFTCSQSVAFLVASSKYYCYRGVPRGEIQITSLKIFNCWPR